MKKSLLVAMIIFCAAILPANAEGDKDSQDDVVELDPIVVTPLRFEEKAVNFPGYVSVITREDIERSNAGYVYDILRNEPSLFVRDWTGVGKTVSVGMRGFGETGSSNVLVLIDGRRVNQIDISGTDWAQIPLEYVERVEVLRGSGSVMYGDNAVAGVINIITRKGKGDFTIKLAYEGGNYRYNNYNISSQGSHEFASYALILKHSKTDGYRLNGDYDGYDFDANITIHPVDNFDMNVAVGYHKDWYGLPGGLTTAEIDTLGRKGSTNTRDRSKTENTYVKISPELRFNVGRSVNAVNIDFWMSKRRINTDWVSMGSLYWSQIDTIAGSVKYLNSMELDSFENTLTVGVDLFKAENRINSTTPFQTKITKKTLGLYAMDMMTLFEKIIINAGIRGEWSLYYFDNVLTYRHQDKSPKQEAIDLGVEYKYSKAGGVYGRYSRSFRFPATDEFYSVFLGTVDTGLKQQVADTLEVGVKDHSWRYLQCNANLYFMEVDNEIYYDPVTWSNDNYECINRRGFELALKSDLHKTVDLFFNYTWTNAYFQGGTYASNKVPMVPENKINFGVVITPFEWMEINFNSDYTGKQRTISDQAAQAPLLKDYFVSNGKITLRYKGWKAFFGINNIFDERYSEYAALSWTGANEYYPAPTRNYVFGGSWEF
ncbi:MAG: TonB-dependent receptor [Candidatus Omnitrophica bacterium]|nr:TonB-dependent receptor [Candidatus Omnitrophota bacterium]